MNFYDFEQTRDSPPHSPSLNELLFKQITYPEWHTNTHTHTQNAQFSRNKEKREREKQVARSQNSVSLLRLRLSLSIERLAPNWSISFGPVPTRKPLPGYFAVSPFLFTSIDSSERNNWIPESSSSWEINILHFLKKQWPAQVVILYWFQPNKKQRNLSRFWTNR